MNHMTHPGDAEAAAAIACLSDQTVTAAELARGQVVRVPRAFGDGTQQGVIYSRSDDRYLGHAYLIDTDEGRLLITRGEIEHGTTNGAEFLSEIAGQTVQGLPPPFTVTTQITDAHANR